MRIAYLTDVDRIGGAERFLATIASGAVGAGHDVTVLSPQPFLLDFMHEAVPHARLSLSRVDVAASASRWPRLGALARAAPSLPVSLARLNTELLHVNNGGYPGSDLCRSAAIAARFVRVPRRLLSVHSAPWPREFSQPQLQAVVDRAVWGSVDAVHATTSFVEARLSELRGMPTGLGRHVPYGVAVPPRDAERVAALRHRLVGSDNAMVVGMISATVDEAKGHGVLIDALARAGTGIRAVIVGPHPGDAFRRRIQELGLAGRVTVEGSVPSVSVADYLYAVDTVVVPSTAFESLPLVVLEAMAAAKAVLASRLSGIPEAVVDGATGRLFAPGAADELAMLLVEANGDRDGLAGLGRAGFERWRSEYSSERMTAAMLELYDELLRGGRRRTSA
jgi:glycosyltransferase involved in cell wall biosynthesis